MLPKRTECVICYNESFMSPCWANNNCEVYVCNDCWEWNNFLKPRKDWDKCLFCMTTYSRYDILIDIECKTSPIFDKYDD